MPSIKFKKDYKVLYSKEYLDYKDLPDLKEDTQHGNQMTKRDLTRVPMIRNALILT